jgi:RNase P subunit RPR2
MPARKRSKDSKRRKNRSSEAINKLSEIVLSPDKNSHRIRDVAARDILRLSKRHGQSNESISRILICRSCESVMRFGRDSRIRIRKQSVITTCLRCENKTRKPL